MRIITRAQNWEREIKREFSRVCVFWRKRIFENIFSCLRNFSDARAFKEMYQRACIFLEALILSEGNSA